MIKFLTPAVQIVTALTLGSLNQSNRNFIQGGELMTDQSTEIGIPIFQIFFERQHHEWTTVVKLQPNYSTIFICYLLLCQNYWTDLHQNFTRYSGISVAIASCIYNAFRFGTPEQRVKVVDFDVCQNAPKLIGYHSNVLGLLQNLSQFCNTHTYDYLLWRLTKISLAVAEIFGRICRFLLSRPTRCSCYPHSLWVIGLNAIKIYTM